MYSHTRRTTRLLTLILAPAVLLIVLCLAPSRMAAASPAAKPNCHRVVKKVHGKRKTVKVCNGHPTPTPTGYPLGTPAPMPSPTPTSTPPEQDNARLAQTLAAAITTAATPDARIQAVHAVMAALHVPVISASGTILVPGFWSSPQDPLLYSFELQAIGGALQRKQRTGLADVSTLLATAGLKQNGGAPIDPETLRQILVSGTQDALSHPSDALSLVPLLVRDLGLLHERPYDLAANPSADAIQFDGLQQMLAVIDFTYPEIHQSAPAPMRA